MKRVPHAQGVDKALRSVRLAAEKALKGLNQAAGQQTKGDYTAAEALAAKGKEIRQFLAEVEAVRKRWREVRGAAAGARGSRSLLFGRTMSLSLRPLFISAASAVDPSWKRRSAV